MCDKVYVVTEQETKYASYYKTFEKAVLRARGRFDDWDEPTWDDITEGRYGYWKGTVDGVFQLVWVEEKNIF